MYLQAAPWPHGPLVPMQPTSLGQFLMVSPLSSIVHDLEVPFYHGHVHVHVCGAWLTSQDAPWSTPRQEPPSSILRPITRVYSPSCLSSIKHKLRDMLITQQNDPFHSPPPPRPQINYLHVHISVTCVCVCVCVSAGQSFGSSHDCDCVFLNSLLWVISHTTLPKLLMIPT